MKSIYAINFAVLFALAGCTNNSTPAEKNITDTQTVAENTTKPEPATDTTKATVSEAWLLVPGKSAGLTQINENAEDVYKRFGKPDGGDAAMQKAVAIWFADHDSTKHSTAIFTARDAGNDPAARVKQIRITSPSFQTAEGIHTGSTLKEIEAVYPVQKGETYTDAGTQYRVYDSKKGIAFEVRPDGICVAIVIHEAGVLNGGTTYLKFRTTNKFINKN